MTSETTDRGGAADEPDTAGRDDKGALASLQEALGDDFDVKRRLGQGSMASVYLAKERELGRWVAVKVLLPGRAGDETARRRFEREARAAASLTHPNVVPVFRFGRLPDETPYQVMRFVKGRTMEERLKAEGHLPAALARQILSEVTAALAAAHAHGIVHRDVRPANVLWDEESETALLSDFGIAALLNTTGEETTRLTKTGQMIGDPRYLSPEQLLDQDLTELSDMYALGVLGFELYTGEGPYEARTNTQIIAAHLSGEPRDLRRIRPDVDPGIADLLTRCLHREPKHRPSASDAARILSGGDLGAFSPLGRAGGDRPADLDELIRRRVPQIVLVAAGAGYLLLQVTEMVFDNDSLVFLLALPLVVAGVAVSTVIAWFHGERGRQRSNVIEWMMLGSIAAVWVTVSTWIFLAGPRR